MDPHEILQLKVRLLTQGATLPEGEDAGRKGGAGPVGGRYFLLPNGRPCGIPIRSHQESLTYHSASLRRTNKELIWLYDEQIELQAVPVPEFYSKQSTEGTPLRQIALLHGLECLATTVYQSCRYWTSGIQCKFCTIPNSYLRKDTILEKTPRQIAEVVKAAEVEGIIHDLLLTTGTPSETSVGIDRFTAIAEAVREVSSIPIAVQFEPPVDMAEMSALKDAGVTSVGLHIESFDDKIRRDVCPGKYSYASYDKYLETWKRAIELFGKGNVTTFVLYGMGEDEEITLSRSTDVAKMGVLPIITPIRPSQGSQMANFVPSYVGNLDRAVSFFEKLGMILFSSGLNPQETLAGCSRCGACTPIQEAYDSAAAKSI